MRSDRQSSPPARRTPSPGRHRATASVPAVAAVLATVLVAVLVAGCGTSGRTLRDPAPGATAPPRRGASSTTQAAIGAVPVGGLAISSTGWTPGGEIPTGYTCDGQGISPPLSIAGAPEGSVELVLVVTDQDAGGFVHWIVAGIPPGAPSFPQGGIPAGAIEAPNTSGTTAWSPPCPPSGTTHTYDFTLYALSAASGLGPVSTLDDLDAVLPLATSTAAMTGTYTRA